MPQKDARGSYVCAIHHRAVSWAVSEIAQTLGVEKIAKMKIASGEHLAAILTTAFLGSAPIGVDTVGQPDLVFDLSQWDDHNVFQVDLVGRTDVQFADFEVKSLPGRYREFDAGINRAISAGTTPDGRSLSATFRTANDVLRGAGQTMIASAWEQLQRKSRPDRSRNIFLIAHFLDYPIVECMDAPIIAHHLDALTLPDGIDSVWVLFAPHSLVVWSASLRRWTNLIFSAIDPGETLPGENDGLDLLQHVDLEFQKQTGTSVISPYVYGLDGQRTGDGRRGTTRT